MNRRVVIVGIGGASCSGKTILAKHLQRVLPGNPLILHQDDFAPSEEDLPYSHGVRDWDDPPTAIRWDDFRSALRHTRETGRLPESHKSHDHLNKQIEVGIDPDVSTRWRGKFRTDVTWVIVDGFLLFWDEEIVSLLDVKIMLRVPRELLKQRREERQTYVTESGEVWTDPPNYFDQIVWPAYVKGHEHLLSDASRSDLTVLSVEDGPEGMTKAFESSCSAIDAIA